MKSNFQFLQSEWSGFFTSATEAESLALNVPRSSVFEARYTLEQVVNWLYNNDDYLVRPYRDNLASLIHEQTFQDNLAPGLFGSIRFIWETGNHAAHKAEEEKTIDAIPRACEAYVGLQIIGAGYFQAIGKPKPALFLSMSRQFIFLIPLMLLLPIRWGVTGIMAAFPVAGFLSALITIIWLIRELQKLKEFSLS